MSNSHFIAARVKEFWGRDSDVVHPFADLRRFQRPRLPGKNYIMVGAFAPYKRVDLAIAAFNQMKLPLLIVGGGQDQARLKATAGPTVEFLGALSNDAVTDLLSRARAFVFPGLEDFGITPIEAMAAGCPVIAFGEGGAAETVTSNSGVFFRPQTVEALVEAVQKLESGAVVIQEEGCRERAAHFSKERFQTRYIESLERAWVQSGRNVKNLPRIGMVPRAE
jgi:glycosyltransferase involved in cell wall biosynthesis